MGWHDEGVVGFASLTDVQTSVLVNVLNAIGDINSPQHTMTRQEATSMHICYEMIKKTVSPAMHSSFPDFSEYVEPLRVSVEEDYLDLARIRLPNAYIERITQTLFDAFANSITPEEATASLQFDRVASAAGVAPFSGIAHRMEVGATPPFTGVFWTSMPNSGAHCGCVPGQCPCGTFVNRRT